MSVRRTSTDSVVVICVDKCVTKPCMYGGICTDNVVFMCVDERAENPCLYLGTCTDRVVVICVQNVRRTCVCTEGHVQTELLSSV